MSRSTLLALDRPAFRRIVLENVRASRGRLVTAVACLTGLTVTELLAPWPLKVIFDHVLLQHPLPLDLPQIQAILQREPMWIVAAMAIAIISLALVNGLCSYLQTYSTAAVTQRFVHRLRQALFDHVQRLPLDYHLRVRSGELITRIGSDVTAVKDVFSEWMMVFAGHALTLVGMVLVMFWLDWQLSLVATASLPLLYLALTTVNRRIRENVRLQRREEGRLIAHANEVIGAIAAVQAFGRSTLENARFDQVNSDNRDTALRAGRMTAAVGRLVAIVSAMAVAATILLGVWLIGQGRLTPGELLVFVAYVRSAYKPIRDLSRLSARFTRAQVSAERIAEVLEAPLPPSASAGLPASSLWGDIEFQNVCFGYSAARPVLSDVSFRIRAGERVAIVGPSGTGKSSIVNLLLNLYAPQSGAVRIDGIDVHRYHADSLRQAIGVVLQDTVLFGATIRENIGYANPEATLADIERAARRAHAHEFIVDLPDGYETVIAERGGSLSGGQRQRICLARALLKDPPILILDEPTSNVDAASATIIRESLRQIHGGKTMIVIAHQLYEMDSFDQILVIEDGRIVESGHHEHLLGSRGRYYQLVRGQATGNAAA